MRPAEPLPTPLSRTFAVATLGDRSLEVPIEATEDERARLARVNELPAVHRFEARFRVAREGRGGVRVSGRVTAGIRQICVVTLDPFDSELTEEVAVHYAPEADLAARRAPSPPGAPPESADTDEDVPDPIVDGKIDLGALAAEFFALALDPHPRKPGVSFDEAAVNRPATEDSPFTILAKLKSGPSADE